MIKLILVEDGSEIAAQLWAATEAGVSSRLAYPEARAALAAAERSGRIPRDVLRRTGADLGRLFEELYVIEVDGPLAESAGNLAERHTLRANGAVHLASALRVDPNGLVVATWDRELGRAARAEGRSIVPPVAP